MKRIFKITVPKWSEHNKGHRGSYKRTMIANNFCTDAKILSLPLSTRWLFLGIILECGSYNKDTIEVCERQLKAIMQAPTSCIKALDRLQSLQLLSYEILALNRREEKRREGNESNAVELKPEPPKSPPRQSKEPELHQLAEIWNQNCGKLPKVKITSNGRLKRCRARWGDRTREQWVEIVRRIAASEFCTGKNDRGWMADFDFLLKPDTWVKVVEGKYDARKNSGDVHRGWADAFSVSS